MKGAKTDSAKAPRPDWQSSNAAFNARFCRSLAHRLSSLGGPEASKSKLPDDWLADADDEPPSALSILDSRGSWVSNAMSSVEFLRLRSTTSTEMRDGGGGPATAHPATNSSVRKRCSITSPMSNYFRQQL